MQRKIQQNTRTKRYRETFEAKKIAMSKKTKASQDVIDAQLTTEEREWAFELEEALYGREEIESNREQRRRARALRFQKRLQKRGENNAQGLYGSTNLKYKEMPTDFELATHALIGKGNTQKALKRIRRLQQFKEFYRVPSFDCENAFDNEFGEDHNEINEAVIEAVLLCIKKFLMAYPEFIKTIGMDKHGRVTSVIRLRGLRWSRPPPFNHTESDRMRALYCLLNALQPTVEAVRRGTIWIADLGGVNERPAQGFWEGCRKLLKDSYPLRVEDIPVVRCPPVYSGAFAFTYPYWSRHFAQRFIRTDPETIRNHFPKELLAIKRPRHEEQTTKPSMRPKDRKKKQERLQQQKQSKVAPNGDEYNDDGWENLDEDSSEFDNNEYLGEDDYESFATQNLGGAEFAIGKANINDELWTKIERLVRMRFETERTFRVA